MIAQLRGTVYRLQQLPASDWRVTTDVVSSEPEIQTPRREEWTEEEASERFRFAWLEEQDEKGDRRVRKKSSTIRIRTHAFTHSAQCLIADILAKRAEGTHGGLAVWSSGREESADSILTHSPPLPPSTNVSLRASPSSSASRRPSTSPFRYMAPLLSPLSCSPFPCLFHVAVLVFLLLVFFHDHHERLLPVPEWAAIFRKLSPSSLLPLAHSRFSSRSLARALALARTYNIQLPEDQITRGMGEALHARYAITKPRSHWPTWDQLEDPTERRDADAPGLESSVRREREEGRPRCLIVSFFVGIGLLRKLPTWPLAGSEMLSPSSYFRCAHDRSIGPVYRRTGIVFQECEKCWFGLARPTLFCILHICDEMNKDRNIETEKCSCTS